MSRQATAETIDSIDLDWSDSEVTTPGTEASYTRREVEEHDHDPRVRPTSYVGVAPVSEDGELDPMSSRHRELVVRVNELSDSIDAVHVYDHSAAAAVATLRVRQSELARVRDALSMVCLDAEDPRVVFASCGPIGAYLAGVYLWSVGVSESLITLARDLRVLQPDWSTLRQRLSELNWLYDMACSERAAMQMNKVPLDAVVHVQELVSAMVALRQGIEEPFG